MPFPNVTTHAIPTAPDTYRAELHIDEKVVCLGTLRKEKKGRWSMDERDLDIVSSTKSGALNEAAYMYLRRQQLAIQRELRGLQFVKLTPEQANEVFDLVRVELGVPESERPLFLEACAQEQPYSNHAEHGSFHHRDHRLLAYPRSQSTIVEDFQCARVWFKLENLVAKFLGVPTNDCF